MAKDNQVLVRVNDPAYDAIEEFADDRDYTNAEAVRRIIETRLVAEGYLKNDGRAIADGGQVMQKIEELETAIADGGMSDRKIDELETEIGQLEDRTRNSDLILTGLMAVATFWIAVEFTIGLPAVLIMLTGIPIAGALAYQIYREWY